MSTDIIHSKIELLEAQIENIERSGYFTEKEIDRLSAPLRSELAILKAHLPKYGMTPEEYNEGVIIHNACFSTLFDDVKIKKAIIIPEFHSIDPDLVSILKNQWEKYGRNLMNIQG